MSIDAKTLAWLKELLTDAAASPRLNGGERSFLDATKGRLDEWGGSLSISEAQMTVLTRIEGKIHAAG